MPDTETRAQRRLQRARRVRSQRIVLAAVLAVVVLGAAGGLAYGQHVKAQRKNQLARSAASAEASATTALSQAGAATNAAATTSPSATSPTAAQKKTPTPQDSQQKTTPAPVAPAKGALAGKVICIDPGHQAHADTSPEPIGPGSGQTKPKVAGGTSGVATRIPEGQTVLEIGLKLKAALEAQGATVVMTRTTQNVNVSNSQRAAIANNAQADLFIRLHCDGAASSSTHGISMLVPAKDQWTGPIVSSSRSAGEAVQAAVIAATGAKNNGVVTRSDLSGFNYCKVPSILIEMGFMTNPAEDRALNSADYQARLVKGLTQGCINWLK
ncbi:MAG: N-acetylmuramoyl-L-alanine amidase [Coriobacteriia bacterium]|nr:N-acetylmuramoyl-L-alanine amidase [Coriobacteriia bacterium]